MKILFLSRWFPYPVDNGSKIRIFNLIKHLSARHAVDLISFSNDPVAAGRVEVMRRYCRKVAFTPYRPFTPRRWSAMLGFLSSRPRSVRDTYHPEMQALVEQALRETDYDALIASQMDMAPYALRAPGVPRILEEIELTTLYEHAASAGSRLSKMRRSLMWRKWGRYTAYILERFDGYTVVSEQEQARVLSAAGNDLPLQVVPNGVDVACYSRDYGPPEPDSLVFSGSLAYGPNFEAVDVFLREILPLVKLRRPAARLTVTGRLDGVPLEKLPQVEGVHFTGFLDDVRPAVAAGWANVVPLQSGGGTRLKVLESLALGTPVVSTPKGVEGLDLAPGSDFLLSSDPSAFAEAVVSLLENEPLRSKLSAHGRRTIASRYDWNRIGPRFCDYVEQTIHGKRRS